MKSITRFRILSAPGRAPRRSRHSHGTSSSLDSLAASLSPSMAMPRVESPVAGLSTRVSHNSHTHTHVHVHVHGHVHHVHDMWMCTCVATRQTRLLSGREGRRQPPPVDRPRVLAPWSTGYSPQPRSRAASALQMARATPPPANAGGHACGYAWRWQARCHPAPDRAATRSRVGQTIRDRGPARTKRSRRRRSWRAR